MKRTLLCLSLIVISVGAVNAQISKGIKTIGGSVFFTNSKQTGEASLGSKGNNLNIAPSFGVAIKDNLIFGGELLFINGKHTQGTSEIKSTGYGVGAFIRKYQPLGNSNFYVYGQARVGARFGTSKNSNGATEYKTNNTNVELSVQPGISYAITKRFHIETSIANLFAANYTVTNRKDPDIKTSDFGVRANLGSNTELQVGVRFFF